LYHLANISIEVRAQVEFKPSKEQHLYLWCLAVEPGRPASKTLYALKPTSRRKELEKTGLIEVSRRGRCKIPVLTEKGWYALEQNLGAPLSKAGAASAVLQSVLNGVRGQVQRGRLSLADFVPTSAAESASHADKDSPVAETQKPPRELTRRVYDACRQIVGDGVYGVRIRLADLRAHLPDVPRPELDRQLKDLERSHSLSLFSLDDPREIRPEDNEAAIRTSSGASRHILLLSTPN
jgi:hypothetical protein